MLNLTPIAQLASAGNGLDLDTKVYRIVDFFSAANLVETRRLRLTRISDYSDVNEGIDQLAKSLVSSVVDDCALPGDRLRDPATVATKVAQERRRQFVSCWSKSSESHAMWAMYSPDRCSVKMQTTVGKLLEVCRASFAESWVGLNQEPGLDDWFTGPLVVAADVLPVRYEDLHRLLSRLSRRKRLALRVIKHAGFKNDFEGRGLPKSMQRLDQKWGSLLRTQFLKDAAYAYKTEIRICIRLGLHTSVDHIRSLLNDPTVEDYENSVMSARMASSLKSSISWLSQPVDEEDAPTAFFSKIEPNFIESVCIDPRAAQHKLTFIEQYFRSKTIKIERSKSFNAAYENLHAYPHS